MKDIFLITVFLGLTGFTPITTDCAGAVDYLSPQALVSSENGNLLYIAQGKMSGGDVLRAELIGFFQQVWEF